MRYDLINPVLFRDLSNAITNVFLKISLRLEFPFLNCIGFLMETVAVHPILRGGVKCAVQQKVSGSQVPSPSDV